MYFLNELTLSLLNPNNLKSQVINITKHTAHTEKVGAVLSDLVGKAVSAG